MLDLTLKTETLPDETAIVSVAGELDMCTSPSLKQELAAALESGAERVIVDLSRCEFLDSSAIAVLLTTRARLEDKMKLILVATDRNILMFFHITGLDRVFRIEPTIPTPQLHAISA